MLTIRLSVITVVTAAVVMVVVADVVHTSNRIPRTYILLALFAVKLLVTFFSSSFNKPMNS